jgi:hypothetical protein
MDFLLWLEEIPLSAWVRSSPGLYAYPLILGLHAVGLAWLVGPTFVIDLRLLGFAPSLPLRQLGRFFPIMVAAFWLNAVTGVILVIAYASTMIPNPALYPKLLFIALAVVVLRAIMKVVRAPDPDSNALGRARILAVLSLLLWFGAIISGRLMAYVHLLTE